GAASRCRRPATGWWAQSLARRRRPRMGADGAGVEDRDGRRGRRIGSPDRARLRVGHNPDQGTTEALSQPFVVFVNDGTNPRYRLTQEQAYELLTSLQQALGILKTR